MMILKTVVMVLLVFWAGVMTARFVEITRWDKALNGVQVGKDNPEFIKGVIWAYEMVMNKKDTRP